jgi:anti-sigma regulatory factor (Ser/Thr protein kinase)
LTDEQVLHLRQAVMEMGQNAIEWGNKHQSDRLVNITYRVHDDHLEIIIRDQGAGFDRSNIPHAAVVDDPFSHLDVRDKLGLRSGGFGLLICEGMVDELRYNDVGNEVTLIKRFAPADGGAQSG